LYYEKLIISFWLRSNC